MSESIKYRVAQKGFKSQNLFNISAFIEITHGKSTYPICEDVVFLEFYSGTRGVNGFKYDTNNKKVMISDADEIIRLDYGCKELLKNGQSQYVNYTDPGLTENSSGNKKKLTLGMNLQEDKNIKTFFVNFEEKQTEKIAIQFDAYGFAAFADSINVIANECETVLFNYQRKMEIKVNKEKNQNQ